MDVETREKSATNQGEQSLAQSFIGPLLWGPFISHILQSVSKGSKPNPGLIWKPRMTQYDAMISGVKFFRLQTLSIDRNSTLFLFNKIPLPGIQVGYVGTVTE